MNQLSYSPVAKVIDKCVELLSCGPSRIMELMEEIVLAHQVGVDPLGVHELFVLAAAAGGGLLLGLRLYAHRARRRIKLWFLLPRREYYRAGERIRHHH